MEELIQYLPLVITIAAWLITVGIYRQKITNMESRITSLEAFDTVTNKEYHELNGDIKVLTEKLDRNISLLEKHDESSDNFREEVLQRLTKVESNTNGK